MLKDWKIILILILLGAIVLLILFQPTKEPPDTSHAFKEEISRLNTEKAQISSRFNVEVQAYKDTLKLIRAIVANQSKENSRLSQRIAQSRPIVQPILDTIPILKRFVEQQDSLIQHQAAQIDTLKGAFEFHAKSFDDLVKIHINSERVSEEIQTANAARIQELEKLNEKTFKKMKRQTRLWKTVAVIGTVGGLLAGSQL